MQKSSLCLLELLEQTVYAIIIIIIIIIIICLRSLQDLSFLNNRSVVVKLIEKVTTNRWTCYRFNETWNRHDLHVPRAFLTGGSIIQTVVVTVREDVNCNTVTINIWQLHERHLCSLFKASSVCMQTHYLFSRVRSNVDIDNKVHNYAYWLRLHLFAYAKGYDFSRKFPPLHPNFQWWKYSTFEFQTEQNRTELYWELQRAIKPIRT